MKAQTHVSQQDCTVVVVPAYMKLRVDADVNKMS